MRWLPCACLLVVGCFDPPTGPPYKVHLLSAEPPVVALHGGDMVTVHFEGDLQINTGVAVDGVVTAPNMVDPEARVLTFITPAHEEGPVGLGLVDTDRGRQIAYNANLLAYDTAPARPATSLSLTAQDSLSWPLHPELSHPCARGGTVYIENVGDEPLTVTGAQSSNPEFMLTVELGQPLQYGDYSMLDVCFTSTTPGNPTTTLTAYTSGGDVTANIGAFVTQPLSGLDPTFHGGGVVFNIGQDTYSGKGIIPLGGNGIVTWSPTRLIALDLAGNETRRDIAAQIGSVPANWILAVRAAPSGGVYALVAYQGAQTYATVLHFDSALVMDSQFDLPIDATNAYRDLQVAPSGRILVIGQQSILAIANGVIDTTYGTNGRASLPSTNTYGSVIDSQGRVYVVIGAGVFRYTEGG